MRKVLIAFALFAVVLGGIGVAPVAQAATEFTNKTMGDGLGSNAVNDVYVVGNTVYAGTNGGLSISTDGGATFTNKTIDDGLGANQVFAVYAVGSTVYAAVNGGLSISTDGGATFTNKTPGNSGLGSNTVISVYAIGSTVYAGTQTAGLSISTNGGNTFINKTSTDGLGDPTGWGVYAVPGSPSNTVYVATFGGPSISTDGGGSFTYTRRPANGLATNTVTQLYAVGSTVYASTAAGLGISTNGGSTFTNMTTTNGLGGNIVWGVYAVGNTVYAATIGGLSISTNGGTSFDNKTIVDGLGNNQVNGVYVADGRIYAATDYGLSMTAAPAAISGPDVPTAPMQAYGRDIDGKCVTNAPIWVNWLGIATQQYVAWGASWQQWPNNGTGGYVCQRQPYFTSAGTWSVQ